MEKAKNRSKEVLIIGFIFLLSIIFAMQSNLNIWSHSGETRTDSSVFKTIAFLMTKGYMPYLDTFDHKGPLMYIYNWMGLQISYWRGIWIIEVLNLFCTFVIIYKIARLYCGKLSSCIVLLITTSTLFEYFEGGNVAEEYALPFISISLFIFIDYFINSKLTTLRLMICGLSLGAVCMLRANMISVWIVFCVAVLVKNIKEKTYKQLINYIGFFLVGLSSVVVPILIWLFAKGALADFINDYLVFNRLYSSSATERAALINKYSSFSFFLNNTLLLLSIVVLMYFAKTKECFFNVVYFTCIFVTLLLICISGQKYLHYGIVLVPLFPYPLALLGSLCENSMRENSPALLLALGYLLVIVALPKWISAVDYTAVCYDTRNENKMSQTVSDVVDVVINNTTEDDKITVWGNWNIIYALSRRVPASKYSYQYPICEIEPNILNEYYDDIEHEQPKLIIAQGGRSLEYMAEIIRKYNYVLIYGEEIDQSVRIYKKTE